MILWWLSAGAALLLLAPSRNLSARQAESDLQVSQQAESDLQVYLRIVDRYRSGSVMTAASELRSLGPIRVDSAVDLLRFRIDRVAPDDELRRQLRAAAVFHTELAVNGSIEMLSERSWHLTTAKRLVDLESRAARSDVATSESRSFARRWALLVAWYRHGTLDLHGLQADIAELTGRFPNDPDVVLLSGSFAETLAWPRLPAAATAVPASLQRAFQDRGARLKDARSACERALQLAPGLDEARLRLAHVYGEMKQSEQAIAAFQIVVRETSSDWVRYLAQLFWGRSCEALDRVEEATEHYRQASAICPECQVPRVALSNAYRKAGDREDAMRAAESVAGIRAATVVDPWFEYYLGQYHRVPAMLLELRSEVGITR